MSIGPRRAQKKSSFMYFSPPEMGKNAKRPLTLCPAPACHSGSVGSGATQTPADAASLPQAPCYSAAI